MAKYKLLRWDDANVLPKLLDSVDTAGIDTIDISGSAGPLVLGSGSATTIVLGNSSAQTTVSGNLLILSRSIHPDNIRSVFGTNLSGAMYYDTTLQQVVISGSNASPIRIFGAVLSASNAKFTGTFDHPGQQSFLLDGTAVSTNNFTAPNLSILFNGSDAAALHTHTNVSVLSLTGTVVVGLDLLTQFTAGTVLTGTQLVYMSASGQVGPAFASGAGQPYFIVGIVSGTTSTFWSAGNPVKVHTTYGSVISGFTNLLSGTVYYLGNATGSLTTTPGFTASSAVVRVGIAKSNTELIYQPYIVTEGLS